MARLQHVDLAVRGKRVAVRGRSAQGRSMRHGARRSLRPGHESEGASARLPRTRHEGIDWDFRFDEVGVGKAR